MKEELRKSLFDTSIKIATAECNEKLLEIEVRKLSEALRTLDSKKADKNKETIREKLISELKLTRRRIEKIEGLLAKKKNHLIDLNKRVIVECEHPIYYNVGFFLGNNPITEVPIDKANYRIDKCIECGHERIHRRVNGKKRDTNWYITPYNSISEGYTDLRLPFETIQKLYQKEYIDHPEAEAITKVKSNIRNRQRICRML